MIIFLGIFLRLWVSHFKITFIDYDPFYHARIAEYIQEYGFLPRWDPHELGGIPYYYPPAFHILMSVSQFFFTPLSSLEVGSILNVFLGVLSIPFLYLLTREEFGSQIAIIAIILFTVSPALVFRSSLWARPNGLNIFLPILAVYVFSKIQKNTDLTTYLLALLVSIFYIISHSFVILTLSIIWIAILTDPSHKNKLIHSTIFFIT